MDLVPERKKIKRNWWSFHCIASLWKALAAQFDKHEKIRILVNLLVYVAWNSATQNLRVTTHSLQDPSQLAPSGYSYAMDDGHKWTMARPRPQIPYAITSHDFLAHFSTLYNGKEYRRGNFNKNTVGKSI